LWTTLLPKKPKMGSFLSLSFLVASIALAQQQNCGPAEEDTSNNKGNSEIQIAGSGLLKRLAGAWMQGFEKQPEVCPNIISIMVEAGGSSSGAARVYGASIKSPVEIGSMCQVWHVTNQIQRGRVQVWSLVMHALGDTTQGL
jgi:ABC-type phosphate transport system substrate-binding protein